MNNDLLLYYSGGSGGFLALHTILLSGVYYSYPYDDYVSMVNKQWNTIPDDKSLWKNTEIWPNNEITAKSNRSKLFFMCNPSKDDINKYHAIKKILLYTTIDIQYELMNFKRANYFYEYPACERHNKIWCNYYNGVKDINWPSCDTPFDFKSLPTEIQNEMIEYFDAEYYISNDVVNDEIAKEKKQLEYRINAYMIVSDYMVSLTDLIKSKGNILTELLNIPYNKYHDKLFKKWMSLHPQNIQQLLTKE